MTELSLPGTWHSTDSRYQGTQYTTLASQYEKGIRAFETHATVTYNGDVEYSGTPTFGAANVTSSNGPAQRGDRIGTNNYNWSRPVTYTRTRTASNVTVSNVKYTVTNSAGNDMLQGLKNLGSVIGSGEFAVVEIGSPSSSNLTVPAIGATATCTETKTIIKTQTGTGGPLWWNISWNDIQAPTDAEWDAAEATTRVGNPSHTMTGNSFVLGISWLLNQLKADGSNIYTKGITPTTSIGDVAGTYIIKVNTNKENNQNTETGWPASTVPALFSRWIDNSEENFQEVNLAWDTPRGNSPSGHGAQTPRHRGRRGPAQQSARIHT